MKCPDLQPGSLEVELLLPVTILSQIHPPLEGGELPILKHQPATVEAGLNSGSFPISKQAALGLEATLQPGQS